MADRTALHSESDQKDPLSPAVVPWKQLKSWPDRRAPKPPAPDPLPETSLVLKGKIPRYFPGWQSGRAGHYRHRPSGSYAVRFDPRCASRHFWPVFYSSSALSLRIEKKASYWKTRSRWRSVISRKTPISSRVAMAFVHAGNDRLVPLATAVIVAPGLPDS